MTCEFALGWLCLVVFAFCFVDGYWCGYVGMVRSWRVVGLPLLRFGFTLVMNSFDVIMVGLLTCMAGWCFVCGFL